MALIAFDLDGTLLTAEKTVSPRTCAALERAAARGHLLVPATGRSLQAIPRQVLDFPFVRYVISINGANVYDQRTGETLLRAELPRATVLALLDFVARYDAMVDCYWRNAGWIDRDFYERVRYYNADEEVVRLIRQTRTPVDSLAAFIRERAETVQKVQLCFRDMGERAVAARELAARFPEILVTSSFRNNLELNARDADKGRALRALAAHVGVAAGDTLAFGDSSNDLAMLAAAGTGVAMGNAAPEVRAACAYVADTNEADGVAAFLEAHGYC